MVERKRGILYFDGKKTTEASMPEHYQVGKCLWNNFQDRGEKSRHSVDWSLLCELTKVGNTEKGSEVEGRGNPTEGWHENKSAGRRL